jgi:hypothetical protein
MIGIGKALLATPAQNAGNVASDTPNDSAARSNVETALPRIRFAHTMA